MEKREIYKPIYYLYFSILLLKLFELLKLLKYNISKITSCLNNFKVYLKPSTGTIINSSELYMNYIFTVHNFDQKVRHRKIRNDDVIEKISKTWSKFYYFHLAKDKRDKKD